MKFDRFKDFDPEVREAVLHFEREVNGSAAFFDVDELLVVIDYYLEVEDFEGLEEAVSCGEGLYPNNRDIRLRRAHCLGVNGQCEEAMRILDQLKSDDPANTDVSFAMGAVYSMMGQPGKAIECYLQASADGFELNMIYGNVADEYYKLGNREKAIRYYRKAIEIRPNDQHVLHNYACTMDEISADEEAIEYIQSVLEQHPYSEWAWYTLGCLYMWLNLYERAADAFKYCLVIDSTLENAYLGLAQSYSSLKQLGTAVQVMRELLDIIDDRARVLYLIGSLYFENGNYHTATVYFRDSIKADERYSNGWRGLGMCSEQQGYYDEAAGYYRHAINVAPDIDDNWLSLADLYINQSRFREALNLLRSACQQTWDKLPFYQRMCYTLIRLGKREQAKDLVLNAAPCDQRAFVDLLTYYPDLIEDADITQFLLQFVDNKHQ